ncbi:HAD family hydrolase [Brachybacterium sp. YJGR34]|uniref:HAD family hydrolase n=1 Tax=Brachybacterium sp. YJGR34 TaxID=2059911 RepID=UPI000E0BCDA2|nr:HAD family hydrolase [Brachybacterium sp. YJGR34]
MLLLLDLDNTLVDRDGAFERWAADFVAAQGGTAEDLDWLLSTDGHGYTHRAVLADGLIERLSMTASRDELVHTLLHDHVDAVRCYDVLLEHLRALHRDGHTLVVVTNGTVAQQTRKLQVSGLSEVVNRVVISEAVAAKKPSAGIFAAALDGFAGDRAPWMIGDHVRADILGGQQAGCRTGWVSHDRPWTGDEPPTLRARTTLEVLERISSREDASV